MYEVVAFKNFTFLLTESYLISFISCFNNGFVSVCRFWSRHCWRSWEVVKEKYDYFMWDRILHGLKKPKLSYRSNPGNEVAIDPPCNQAEWHIRQCFSGCCWHLTSLVSSLNLHLLTHSKFFLLMKETRLIKRETPACVWPLTFIMHSHATFVLVWPGDESLGISHANANSCLSAFFLVWLGPSYCLLWSLVYTTQVSVITVGILHR